ncbi:MAG: type II toxin-antitoxin system RelE/ParE family toxin [Bacteroides sp.]|nr:type II toxin-antitoxin system RelE/ParE family toxin [Bacteroides sp.]
MEEKTGDKANIRKIYRTSEFDDFYSSLPSKVKDKFEYVFLVVQTVYNVSTKFVKHIENTELYELRVAVGSNEYRTVLFAIDHDNVIESSRIILLNGFLKKSSKDYKKQIEKARTILKNLQQ